MARLERSAGFVIYHQASSPGEIATIEFLLLDYGRHWDFPKGHVEAGETDLDAAVRELREETGMQNPRIVPGFQQEVSYYFRHKRHGIVNKTVILFLAEVSARKVLLSEEHRGYAFLRFDEAVKRLTFPTARQVLREAWAKLQNA